MQMVWYKTALHIKWLKSIIIPSFKLIGYWIQPIKQFEKVLTKYANKLINIHEYANVMTQNCTTHQVTQVYHHTKLQVNWVLSSAYQAILKVFLKKYANKLINIHEYGNGMTHNCTTPKWLKSHHTKLQVNRVYWVQATKQFESVFWKKYAKKLINIHEYANSMTQIHTTHQVTLIYHHTKLQVNRVFSNLKKVNWNFYMYIRTDAIWISICLPKLCSGDTKTWKSRNTA